MRVFLFSLLLAAAPKAPVSLLSSPSASIGNREGRQEVVFVTGSDTKPDVTASLIEVRSQDRVDADLRQLFEVSLDPARGLVVTVDTAKLPGPSAYELRVGVLEKGGETHPLSIVLNVLPGKIEAVPSRLMVTRPWPSGEPSGSLWVTETTGRSRVRGITAVEREPGANGTERISGVLQLPEATLEAGSKIKLEPVLNDAVGLGTTRGRLELRSRDLQEPLLLEYEVVRRLSPCWIFLISPLGLVLGWFLRTFLRSRIELAKKHEEVEQVLRTLVEESSQRSDEILRVRLEKAMKSLEGAKDSLARPEQIDEAIKEAEAELKQALEDYANRMARAREAAEALRALFIARDRVPKKLGAMIVELDERLTGIDEAIESGDAARAEKSAREVTNELNKRGAAAAKEWAESTQSALATLQRSDLPYPKTLVSSAFVETRASVDVLLKSVTGMKVVADDFVREANAALHKVESCLAVVLEHARGTALAVASQLKQDKAERIRAALEELPPVPGASDAEVNGIERAAQAIEALTRKIEEALQPDGGKEQPAEIAELISNRQLEEAAKKLRELRAGSLLGAAEPEGEYQPQATPRVEAAPPIPQPTVRVSKVEQVRIPAPVELGRIRGFLGNVSASLVQTLIVGGLLTTLAYILYAEQFGYSPTDIASVFFWAFGLDVGVNQLLDTAKGMKKE